MGKHIQPLYFRIERFGGCLCEGEEIVLFNREETKDFLREHNILSKYERQIKKLWKGEQERVSLLNLRLPIALELEYTYKCNLRCKYCYAFSSPQRNEIMPFKIFQEIINSINKSSIFEVYVFGGEPLILPKYLKYLLSNLSNKYIGIVSNITLLDENICEIVKSSPNQIEFTVDVDGHEASIHNYTRGGFKQVCRGLELLDKYKIPIRINTCVSPANYDKLEEIIEFLLPYKITAIKFSPIGIEHLPLNVADELDISDYHLQVIKELMRLKEKYRKVVNIGIAFDSDFNMSSLHPPKGNEIVYGPCTAGIIKAGITVDQKLVPCVSIPSKVSVSLNTPFDFETSFRLLKEKLSDYNRRIVEKNGVLRIQNCCELLGYGKERYALSCRKDM